MTKRTAQNGLSRNQNTSSAVVQANLPSNRPLVFVDGVEYKERMTSVCGFNGCRRIHVHLCDLFS